MARRRRSNKTGYTSRGTKSPTSPKRLDRSLIRNERFYYAPITDLDFEKRKRYGLPKNIPRHRRYAVKSAPLRSAPPSPASRDLQRLINLTRGVLGTPKILDTCTRRKIRREVLFASIGRGLAGLGPVRPPRFRSSSTVRC